MTVLAGEYTFYYAALNLTEDSAKMIYGEEKTRIE
jgi:hypothetical protein